MTTTLISDYLGIGLIAARPNPPDVPINCTAVYYATDVPSFTIWNGSTWVGATSGGGTVTKVQSAIAAQANIATGITLPSTPTSGNLLVAICHTTASTPTSNTGWTSPVLSGGSTDAGVAWKFAGGAESATQTPFNGGGAGCQTIYEFSDATGIASLDVNGLLALPTSATPAVAIPISPGPGIVLGAFSRLNTNVPTLSGSATIIDEAVTDAGVGIGMHTYVHVAAALGNYTTTATYGGSVSTLTARLVIV